MRQFVCVIFLKRLVVDLDLSLRAGQKQTFSRFCVFPLPTWRYFADAMGKNQGCEIRGVKIRGAKKMWSKNADADGQWHEIKNARICIWETWAPTRDDGVWKMSRDTRRESISGTHAQRCCFSSLSLYCSYLSWFEAGKIFVYRILREPSLSLTRNKHRRGSSRAPNYRSDSTAAGQIHSSAAGQIQ